MQIVMIEFEVQPLDPQGNPLPRQRHSAQSYSESLGRLSKSQANSDHSEHHPNHSSNHDPDHSSENHSAADSANLELILIPAGQFQMGAPRAEEGWHPSQHPQHEVELKSFWLSRYPITQAQWQQVAALSQQQIALNPKPACFNGSLRPVEQVSWFEATEFCQRLAHYTGRPYRLPSEAEWEYACRAGTHTPFHCGDTLTTDWANYSGINWEFNGKICSKGAYGQGPQGLDRRETTEVGSFGIANPFGLCDLHGLVREWCQDSWHDNYSGAPSDGSAWEDTTNATAAGASGATPIQRVLRGGSWNSSPRSCRSAFRSKLDPASQLYDVGFRIACSAEP
jgi:formylglycine-generating enzyme required for sulfatase activity